MSIDLLLRALRKSSALDRGCIDAGEFDDAVRYYALADQIHKKIVERFETTKVLRVSSPSTTATSQEIAYRKYCTKRA